MNQQTELALAFRIPPADVLKALRSRLNKQPIPSDELDKETAAAFGLPGLRASQNMSDGLKLLKLAVPEWTDFQMEAYAEDADGEPEIYWLKLGAQGLPGCVEESNTKFAYPELSLLAMILFYVINKPKLLREAEATKARREEASKQSDERHHQNMADIAERAAEQAAERKRRAEKTYPDTLEGYVESWADWLDRMDDLQIEDPHDYADAETKAAISRNFQTCIQIMKGQAKAVTIVQELMEAEYAKNPSPRMKALKVAIEAIYQV